MIENSSFDVSFALNFRKKSKLMIFLFHAQKVSSSEYNFTMPDMKYLNFVKHLNLALFHIAP